MKQLLTLVLSLISLAETSVVISKRGLFPLLDGRIYGGTAATAGQIPYQASMRYWGFHRCGGNIFRHDAVLTAAHCVYELSADSLEVAVGTLYINRGGQERNIRLILNHEKFDELGFDNDISILLLEKSLDFSQTIQPIYLASVGEELKAGTIVTISGWGTFNDEGNIPDVLQFVRVRIVGKDECAKAYVDDLPVTENMLCAGEPEGKKDACNGDSGGPLVVAGKLHGIVSWGDGCARPRLPGVYTKIAAYRDWINEKLNW